MDSILSLLISTTMLLATLVYYYKMVLLTEMTTEASLFNTLYAECATPQMMDSLRAVEEFSLTADVTPEQIACNAHDEDLDRQFDYDWQRLLLYTGHQSGTGSSCTSTAWASQRPLRPGDRRCLSHARVYPPRGGSCQLYQETNCSEVFDYLRELYDLPRRQIITCEEQAGAASEETTPESAKEEL